MTGYREHSFDPNVYEQPGRPLRPFNWIQWTGVAVGVVGLFLTTLFWLGELGWIGQRVEAARTSFVLLLVGAALINSRRHPGAPITDEQRDKNRKLLVAVALICTAILGIAAVIEFQGA